MLIDEAHNVLTPSVAKMLAEGRSAGLEAVFAWQYSAQIRDEVIRSGVRRATVYDVSPNRPRPASSSASAPKKPARIAMRRSWTNVALTCAVSGRKRRARGQLDDWVIW